MKRIALSLAVAVLWSSVAVAETFTIDASHSSVGFSIRHFVSKVQGRFNEVEGTFNYDEKNPKVWAAQATIPAKSINTGNEKRDEHLRSADFFDAAKFPTLTFKSTNVTDAKGNKAKLHGDLTMHGVTKPVVLDLDIAGTEKDPWGGTRLGATATGVVNRKDFGIIYNKVLDSGKLMLGEDVEITINIEGVLEAKKK